MDWKFLIIASVIAVALTAIGGFYYLQSSGTQNTAGPETGAQTDTSATTAESCPPGTDYSEGRCVLPGECRDLHVGTSDSEHSISFVIVPANSMYGEYDSSAQYSGALDAFAADARKNVDDFLSAYPYSKYSGNFNFRYTTATIDCVVRDGSVECDLWKEAANGCGSYDVVIVLERKVGGGRCCTPILSSAYTTTTFLHEIAHFLGLYDYQNLGLPPGPNFCTTLDCCGGAVCEFSTPGMVPDQKPVEDGGPACCLLLGEMDGVSFYIPNEQSAMSYDIRYKALKFTGVEAAYLDGVLSRMATEGKGFLFGYTSGS